MNNLLIISPTNNNINNNNNTKQGSINEYSVIESELEPMDTGYEPMSGKST